MLRMLTNLAASKALSFGLLLHLVELHSKLFELIIKESINAVDVVTSFYLTKDVHSSCYNVSNVRAWYDATSKRSLLRDC